MLYRTKTKPGFLKRFGAELRIEQLLLCDIIAGSFLRVVCQNMYSQSQIWSGSWLDCVGSHLWCFHSWSYGWRSHQEEPQVRWWHVYSFIQSDEFMIVLQTQFLDLCIYLGKIYY